MSLPTESNQFSVLQTFDGSDVLSAFPKNSYPSSLLEPLSGTPWNSYRKASSNEPFPLSSELDSSTFATDSGLDTSLDLLSGFLTVGDTGQVGIDYLYDGGAYQGELAIFSIEGLEDIEPGSPEFIKEIARRALSDSTLGHIVISDATEAARFTGSLAWEGDFNAGDYLNVKTFMMNPYDQCKFSQSSAGNSHSTSAPDSHKVRHPILG